jgi:FkbM family methyltransferase
MNPLALLVNIHHSLVVCPTWRDRFNRLSWLYSNKTHHNSTPRRCQISFRYPQPINDIVVVVRDNYGSDAFIVSEVFDHRYYDFPLPFIPATVLDLGANAGFTSLFFARKYPLAEIACVEPIENNVAVLRENFELNNVKAMIFPVAVAVEDGFITMEMAEKDYGHKVADISYGANISGQTIDVEALSVPTMINRLGWERINLLKIDIEGYEGVLLSKNCDWLTKVDAICIECHEGYGERDLRAVAERYGFATPQLLPGTWLLVRS